MKKIFSAIMITAAAMLGISSCSTETDESAGGTAVQDMAGNWEVVIDIIEIDENGDSIHYGDYYGFGALTFYTYNTNDNRSDSLYVDDFDQLLQVSSSLWGVKAKVGCNLSNFTISGTNANLYASEDAPETCKVTGRIMPGAATNLHGMPNDSICVDVEFDWDPGWVYRYAGQRYTGFYE